jgi:hypothetical protein
LAKKKRIYSTFSSTTAFFFTTNYISYRQIILTSYKFKLFHQIKEGAPLMKRILQTALLPAIALSLMLAIPAAAVESSSSPSELAKASPNGISFQIPMHDFCSVENAFDFRLQLSNASDKPANVTLFLYHKDGSVFNEGGTSYNGMESSILPGKPLALRGNATEFYHMNFGNHKNCSQFRSSFVARHRMGEQKTRRGDYTDGDDLHQ